MNNSSAIISHNLPKKFKIVFLGDQSVGKTSIIKRYVEDTCDSNYSPTIGVDFLCKTEFLENRTVRLQMWDTAGQERFKSLIPSYIRDSCVAVIVYDITNRESFLNSFKWLEEVRAERGEDIIICLVGNKYDLTKERKVSYDELVKRANELNIMYIETSSKENYNIQKLFKTIAESLPVETTKTEKDENYFVVPLVQSEEKEEKKDETKSCLSSYC